MQIIALIFLSSMSLSRFVVIAKQKRPTNIKNTPRNIILIKLIFIEELEVTILL